MYKTNREVTVRYLANLGGIAEQDVKIPAGTLLTTYEDGLGATNYAVADVALLIKLTGNTHDPHFRWLTLPSDCVIEVTDDTQVFYMRGSYEFHGKMSSHFKVLANSEREALTLVKKLHKADEFKDWSTVEYEETKAVFEPTHSSSAKSETA